MIKVKNRKIIETLSVRSMKGNGGRNRIAVLAIALTTLLFTSVFEMGFGAMDSMQRAMMVAAGGDGHAAAKYITDEEFDKLRQHPLVKEMAYCRVLSDSVNNEGLLKRRAEFWYYDSVGLKYKFLNLEEGQIPQAADEVIADSKTLELLGIPLEVGSTVALDLTVHGNPVKREFRLVGWWNSDPGFDIGQIFTSQSYVEEYEGELYNSYDEDLSMAGTITGYMKFADTIGIEEDLERVLTESGYSMEEGTDHFIVTGVNWSYLTTNINDGAGTMAALLGVMLLFMLTGYLIIYNIFQISVLQDIRFYGLLKTIGTTGKQIRSIIWRQALRLSVVGIPLGLLGGYFVGKGLLPLVMKETSYAGSTVITSLNPAIFLGAVLFTFVTVFISTRKPGRMAAKISPIEAVRYSDAADPSGRKGHRTKGSSTKGRLAKGKVNLYRMAAANLSRNRKRTVLVVAGLGLTLVLTNLIFTFSESVDEQKALTKFCDSDFRIGHADLFNFKYAKTENNLSESFIAAVKGQAGFEEGGRLYASFGTYKSETTKQLRNKQEDGTFSTTCYGLEEFPFSRLKLVDGEMDLKKLETGKYLLEGVITDDYGQPEAESFNHEVGEEVVLIQDGKEYRMTILGHVIANQATNTCGTWFFSSFYLPAQVFLDMNRNSGPMSYMFDAADELEQEMEQFLKQYTESIEPIMNYDSKFTAMASIESLQKSAVMIGGTLAGIIGVIGILNYINAVMTGMITRRREFAMLQSVGMTRRQLMGMLCMEGTLYAALTAGVSIILSLVCSLLIIRPLCGNIWFTQYQFVILPLLIMLPVLFILGLVIPYVTYQATVKKSIVERLREAEY